MHPPLPISVFLVLLIFSPPESLKLIEGVITEEDSEFRKVFDSLSQCLELLGCLLFSTSFPMKDAGLPDVEAF